MENTFTQWRGRIDDACRRKLAKYPLAERELAALLPTLAEKDALCLKALYGGLGPQDVTGRDAASLLEDVRLALEALKAAPWSVPPELFFLYVLPPRVNNEWPDGGRAWLFAQLKELVAGLDITAAALAVNLWCCGRASYTPADDRTIAPLGLCRRTMGRCGEESTLLTAALRSVAIPARQVYAPRWAHCDDNHAWVEFFDGGDWRYMGACEPEEHPDVGWFTAAASRAMLVRALTPDWEEDGCRVVNVTSRYAPTARLTVRLSAEGEPAAGVPIRFQLVNDSRLCTIYQADSGPDGTVSLDTGLGDLVASAFYRGRLMERRVDVRRERSVQLRWEEGRDPLTAQWEERWELTPPRERVPAPPPPPSAGHREALGLCEARRAAYRAGFRQDGPRWLTMAGGNRREIEGFLAMGAFVPEDKEALLDTLTEKDFADVTGETLADALTTALPWKEKFPPAVWKNWVLAPRVEWEPLLPVRGRIARHLAGEGLGTGEDVLAWMDCNIRPVMGNNITDRRGDAAAYLRHGACPVWEWEIVAVQLCRALGIPALIDPGDGRIRLVAGGGAYAPGTAEETFRLRFTAREEPLTYREHFTLARWSGEEYCPLELAHTVRDHWDLFLTPGAYRLTTARRQIDGSLSVRVSSFLLKEDRTLPLVPAPDRTGEKLLRASLPPVMAYPITGTGTRDLTDPCPGGSLLIFAQPGAEPTEHLFQELLELEEAYNKGGWPVSILPRCREEGENLTLRRVLERLGASACYLPAEDVGYLVRRAVGVGDSRLPLAVVLDGQGRGVYASANYNIRAAHTLLRILNML